MFILFTHFLLKRFVSNSSIINLHVFLEGSPNICHCRTFICINIPCFLHNLWHPFWRCFWYRYKSVQFNWQLFTFFFASICPMSPKSLLCYILVRRLQRSAGLSYTLVGALAGRSKSGKAAVRIELGYTFLDGSLTHCSTKLSSKFTRWSVKMNLLIGVVIVQWSLFFIKSFLWHINSHIFHINVH